MRKKSLLIALIVFSLCFSGQIFAEGNGQGNGNPALNPEEEKFNQQALEYIEGRIKVLDNSIDLEDFDIKEDEIGDYYDQVLKTNAEIFYTDTFEVDLEGVYVKTLIPTYKYDGIKTLRMRSDINAKIGEIKSKIITKSMTDFEKERAIHDYLVFNTSYRTNPKQDGDNIYGLLINGRGTSKGYAKSFQYLLKDEGIEAMIVSDDNDYAWNMVKIGEEYYHVDVAANDSPEIKNYTSYKYLNLSDDEMEDKGYSWDGDYPICDSEDFSLLREIKSPRAIGSNLYFSSHENEGYIYKMNLKTLEKTEIAEVEAPYLDTDGEWIYFSNFSQSAYLYKIRMDGSDLSLMKSTPTSHVYIEGKYLYYFDISEEVEKRIDLEQEGEDYTGYKRWTPQYDIVPYKTWEIAFNMAIDEKSINDRNIYIKDNDDNILTSILLAKLDDKTVLVVPDGNYQPGIYYLCVENMKSKSGKILKENIKMFFKVD